MAYKGKPIAIQRPLFRPEDFQGDDPNDPQRGLGYVNQVFSQLVNAANLANGAVGPSVLPSGIDVQGGKLTGLPTPTDPTDAVSLAHASANYSPSATASSFDLGGSNALKGATVAYQQSQTNAASIAAIQTTLAPGISGTLTLAKLTTGGTEGSITILDGIVTAITDPT